MLSRAARKRIGTILIAATSVLLLGFPAGPAANAHALISAIALQVSGSGPDVTLTAEVRYPDHDPVVGETLVGVAYSPSTGRVVLLHPTYLSSSPGFWTSSVHLVPGKWKVEFDAVRKTRGLQSIGFTVAASGAPSEVTSPDPLPATVVAPGASAAGDNTGLRLAPKTVSSSVALATVLFFLGVAIPTTLFVFRGRGQRQLTSSFPSPTEGSGPV